MDDTSPRKFHASPRKISGTKRTAQSSPRRGYFPASSGSGRGFPPRSSGPAMASSSSQYVPVPFQPSHYSAQMRPPAGPRYSVPASVSRFALQRKRTSYPFTQPLAPPQGQRSRYISKRPIRPTDPFSSPISTKRMAPANSTSALPDIANARTTDPRRSAAMTVRDRSVSEYREGTRTKFAYSNESVRKEYDLKFRCPPPVRQKSCSEKPGASTGDDESTSGSESSSDGDDWETVPSDADSELDQLDETDSSDDDSVIILEPPRPPVIELLDDTPPMSPILLPTPTDEILAAMEGLTLSVACMQAFSRLPFLKRNLRRGFLQYCHAHGVPTRSPDSYSSITVVFRLAGNDLLPHEASVSCLECPLCKLHDPFQTREMLELHLTLDHGEVETTWEEIDKENARLVLVLPGKSDDVRMSPTGTASPNFGIELQESIPQPPPPPFGPTARFPFLPAKSEYGGPDIKYSVRFGGPKIYDLLSTLPMEPFGVLGWAIIDKEEEIFESDDMPDEHKVMHALWARWIHFNRNLFIMNYFEGTKSFIDEYWKMIRLAAGSNALRYWLVMLIVNRYLTGKDVALLLKHYEKWCDDDF
ncbi:hypothetical protein K438DRAFT_1809083 [Mycena galopus ATCC 62051]|nr:hypothetical protein K438DRAFT_1809083 [Mycena galopus ATCC 62051]